MIKVYNGKLHIDAYRDELFPISYTYIKQKHVYIYTYMYVIYIYIYMQVHLLVNPFHLEGGSLHVGGLAVVLSQAVKFNTQRHRCAIGGSSTSFSRSPNTESRLKVSAHVVLINTRVLV